MTIQERIYHYLFILLCIVPNTVYLLLLIPLWLYTKWLRAWDVLVRRMKASPNP